MFRLSNRKRLKKLNNKGLSLIEVVVSVTVFGIMVSPIVKQFNGLVKQNYTVKLSQAETDFATRIMEDFKTTGSGAAEESESDSSKTVKGYDISYDADLSKAGITYYSMNNIKIEEDIDPNEKTFQKSNTKYTVKVTTDSDAYKTSTGSNASDPDYPYQDPNNTDYYNLSNVDKKFAVIINETASNYDVQAETDLIDNIVKDLKDTVMYKRWQNGYNIFRNDTYNKNTVISISYDPSKKQYKANVRLDYKENKYGKVVSYVLINDQVFDAKKIGNKPPEVYIFYNQFLQNNKVTSGTDTITIDNSGLGSGSTVGKDDQIKCYLIRGEIKSSVNSAGNAFSGRTETVYTREATDEILGTQNIRTDNTKNSTVTKVTTTNGKDYYYWPSYVIYKDFFDLHEAEIVRAFGANYVKQTVNYVEGAASADMSLPENQITEGQTPSPTMKSDDVYIFSKVYVPANGIFPNAQPDPARYSSKTVVNQYTYLCTKDTTYGGEEIKKGDVIYQKSAREFVLPSGNICADEPENNINGVNAPFDACRVTKAAGGYDTTKKTNILLTANSKIETVKHEKAIKIFTNMVSQGDVSNHNANKFNYLESTDSGVQSIPAGYQKILTDYPHSPSDAKNEIVYELDQNKRTGVSQLSRIKVELYRVVDGVQSRKPVITLESGKEG